MSDSNKPIDKKPNDSIGKVSKNETMCLIDLGESMVKFAKKQANLDYEKFKESRLKDQST